MFNLYVKYMKCHVHLSQFPALGKTFYRKFQAPIETVTLFIFFFLWKDRLNFYVGKAYLTRIVV